MVFTDELYEAARPIWDAQLEHPFVRGIADGTLDPEIFQRWVLQDYLYLKEFARIFAWAVAKAQRLESMAWYSEVLNLTLNTEMELHRSYASRFGITPEDLEAAEMWPTTRAYTDFLVRTAADGDMADLLSRQGHADSLRRGMGFGGAEQNRQAAGYRGSDHFHPGL
jgi:thiaminase (transcriptional activator TenA)